MSAEQVETKPLANKASDSKPAEILAAHPFLIPEKFIAVSPL
jgi:hypothetical protein